MLQLLLITLLGLTLAWLARSDDEPSPFAGRRPRARVPQSAEDETWAEIVERLKD